jgi:cytochrome c-type biogenesis protein CcmE
MKKYGKFAVLIVVLLGAVLYMGLAGGASNATYYKEIAELNKMGDRAYGKRLRVGGDVEAGSIQQAGTEVRFVLLQNKTRLRVAYVGSDPLPDTFRDGSQALADGRLDKDGVFRASKIQAKCASKYAAKPGQMPGQTPSNINTGKSSI